MKNIQGNLYLKKNKDDFLSSFHRWIFSGAVEKLESQQSLKNGDIVKIFNSKKEFVGYAFYEKPQQIVARIFYFGDTEIQDINDYFYQQLEHLYTKKKKLFEDSNAFRLIHSESDGIPGVICDIYNDLSVIQFDYLKSETFLKILVDFLNHKNIQYILLKEQQNIQWLSPKTIDKIRFIENQIHFEIQLDKFQKTGYFLDQKINRKKLLEYSHNKIILDAFCYIGGFGLHALKGNAQKVVFVDAQNLTNQIQENIKINQFKFDNTEIVQSNVFDYLNNIKENYFDLLIVDPPAFVKTKTKIKEAIHGYVGLNRLAIKKIKHQGHIFTFSCSQFIDKELFRKIIFLAAKEEKRNVIIKEYLTQAPDHTISIFHPEGEYLKGLVLYVE